MGVCFAVSGLRVQGARRVSPCVREVVVRPGRCGGTGWQRAAAGGVVTGELGGPPSGGRLAVSCGGGRGVPGIGPGLHVGQARGCVP